MRVYSFQLNQVQLNQEPGLHYKIMPHSSPYHQHAIRVVSKFISGRITHGRILWISDALMATSTTLQLNNNLVNLLLGHGLQLQRHQTGGRIIGELQLR